jgi:hypothetical protein
MINICRKIMRMIYVQNKFMNSQLIKMDLMESYFNLKELEISRFSIKSFKSSSCNEFYPIL